MTFCLETLGPGQIAALGRMEAARRQTENHLRLIERQITVRAERMTIAARAKRRQFGRGRAIWTNADAKLFQSNMATLAFARRFEIEALSRKLVRQEHAIAAFRRRHGLHEAAVA